MDVEHDYRKHGDRRQCDAAMASGQLDRRHIAERHLPEADLLRKSTCDGQTHFSESIKLSEKSEHKIFQEIDVFNNPRHHERS